MEVYHGKGSVLEKMQIRFWFFFAAKVAVEYPRPTV